MGCALGGCVTFLGLLAGFTFGFLSSGALAVLDAFAFQSLGGRLLGRDVGLVIEFVHQLVEGEALVDGDVADACASQARQMGAAVECKTDIAG